MKKQTTWNRLSNAVSVALGKKAVANLDDRYFNSLPNDDIQYSINNTQQAVEAFRLLSYVGFCVRIRSEEISKIPFAIVDKDGNEYNGASKELFNKPMPGLKYGSLINMVVSHLDLDGNFFANLTQDNMYDVSKNKPSQIRPVNPANVNIIDETGRTIVATDNDCGALSCFDVKINNTRLVIRPERMIHINVGSPYNHLRGIGIVQSNASLLEGDKVQDLFDRMFFTKNPMIKMMLTDPNSALMEKDRQMMKSELRREYGEGKESIFLVPAGMKAEFPNISYSELEMVARQLKSRDDILMMFRIPRSYAGLETRFATRDQEEKIWEKTLSVYIKMIEDAFTEIVKKIDGDKYSFKIMRKETVDSATFVAVTPVAIQNTVVTPAEARGMLGLPPRDDCPDIFMAPFNMMPFGESPEQTPEEVKGILTGIDTKGKRSMQARIHHGATITKIGLEKNNKKYINPMFKDMRDRVLSGLNKSAKGANLGDMFNEKVERKAMYDESKRMYQAAITISVTKVNDMLKTKVDASTKNKKIVLVVEKLSTKYADHMVESRKEELRGILAKADELGWSHGEIKAAIEDEVFDPLIKGDGWKAARIARTEAGNTFDRASYLGYEELGVKMCDVIGCEDNDTDCNRQNIPMDEVPDLEFHPNHTGSIVPQIGG